MSNRHRYTYNIAHVKRLSEKELESLAARVKQCLIENNLSAVETIKQLDISDEALRFVQREFNIRKSREQITQVMQRTNIQKFGTPHYSQATSGILTVWQFEQLLEADKQRLIQDARKLYIEDNLNISSVASKLHASKQLISHLCKDYGLKKPAELLTARVKQTTLERYGVDSYAKTTECKKRVKQTCLNRYGVSTYFLTDHCKAANEAAVMSRWNAKNAFESPQFRKEVRKTMLDRYGVEYTAQSKLLQDKMKSTCMDRYGSEHYHSSDEGKLHMRRTALISHGNSSESVDMLLSEDKLRDFILSLPEEDRYIAEISRKLGCDASTLNVCIHKYYNLEHLVYCKEGGYCHSYVEDEVYEFLSSNVNCVRNCRDIISPQEIDIYIPDLNIGVEVNGSYWHSELFRPDACYHQHKSVEADHKGVFLYHIFEYEWKNERMRSIIKSQLLNKLRLQTNRIYARNCTVQEIDAAVCKPFLQHNHLQSFRNATVYLGLYLNEELVAVMSFGRPYFTSGYQWEIYRFCTKLNTAVVGGFSKLFKHFIRAYNPESIMTYSDFSKGTGGVYKSNGFDYKGLTAPGYVWAKESQWKSRYQCQMKGEKQYMQSLGYYRLFDCGNRKWEWRL